MSKLISDDYLSQLMTMHSDDPVWGNGPAGELYTVCQFVEENRIFGKAVLDYGCGKGALLRILGPTLKITGYDPAVSKFSKLPTPQQYTICVDVMEHIEEDKLDNVLQHIAEMTHMRVLFIIAVTDSTKLLPNGKNSHINIKTREEWITVLAKHFDLVKAVKGFTSLRYVGESKYWQSRRKSIQKAKPKVQW